MDEIKRTEENNIPKPKPPLSRHIKEGTYGSCPLCGSTEERSSYWKRRFWIGPKYCINPECKNYDNRH